jgi:importin subunit beta-1
VLTLLSGVPECKGYVDAALQYLLPLLLEGLSKQEEEQDEDTEMNISMSCATCLGLLAQVTGDKLVDAVMQFVTTNIRSEDWHLREAATLAFGPHFPHVFCFCFSHIAYQVLSLMDPILPKSRASCNRLNIIYFFRPRAPLRFCTLLLSP